MSFKISVYNRFQILENLDDDDIDTNNETSMTNNVTKNIKPDPEFNGMWKICDINGTKINSDNICNLYIYTKKNIVHILSEEGDKIGEYICDNNSKTLVSIKI
jgi:hypothetical protein